MHLYRVYLRGVVEVMGPEGRPAPDGCYQMQFDTSAGVAVLTTDSYGLRQLHAMLDPWARALEAREASRGKQGQG